MNHLLATATEVTARVRLEDETKTVSKGALWYEESLPAESVPYALALVGKSRSNKSTPMSSKEVLQVIKGATSGLVQLGGKATVGRGLCHVSLIGGADRDS
jgi:CRISPR-associated protein Cmr4